MSAILVCCILFFSCKNNELELEASAYLFPPLVYKMENNPPNEQKVALGKLLFYDPILSQDSTISCASCHAQEHAFAAHNVALSNGVNGKLGKRNSPALSNLNFYPYFNWDGGVLHIEVQPIGPITDSLEMNESFSVLIEKLKKHRKYPELFKTAFGSEEISDKDLLLALTQFMSTLISDRSKFDEYLKGKATFNEQEKLGLSLFDTHCSTCHSGTLQSNFSFKNNGLTSNNSTEFGRFRITQNEEDKYKFRVPSLRNISLTYPYMHDGSYSSLEAVVKAYTEEKPNHSDISSEGIPLSSEEQKAIVTFLQTLSDYKFIADPAHQSNAHLLLN